MSGFARQAGRWRVRGPDSSPEMAADPRTLIIDMPAQKPNWPKPPRPKGVVGPTMDGDEDHQPGEGAWYDVYDYDLGY